MAAYLGNKELREKSNLNWGKVGTCKEQKTKQQQQQQKVQSGLIAFITQYIPSVPNLKTANKWASGI